LAGFGGKDAWKSIAVEKFVSEAGWYFKTLAVQEIGKSEFREDWKSTKLVLYPTRMAALNQTLTGLFVDQMRLGEKLRKQDRFARVRKEGSKSGREP
jgi:hypothetical protein